MIAIPDTVGSFYLHLLLQSPDRHFTATKLSNDRTLFERGNPSPMVSDDEVGVGGTLDDGQLMDDEGIAFAMQEMNNLENDFQAAKKNHDSAKINELRRKQREIRKYVSAAWRPGGAHTVVNSLHRKAVGRVRKEISRTIDKITELYRDLGLHLEDSITKGPICSYRSQEGIEWYC